MKRGWEDGIARSHRDLACTQNLRQPCPSKSWRNLGEFVGQLVPRALGGEVAGDREREFGSHETSQWKELEDGLARSRRDLIISGVAG